MSETGNMDAKNETQGQQAGPEPAAMGTPLSRGSGGVPAAEGPRQPSSPPERSLDRGSDNRGTRGSRLVHAFRSAMPVVQRLLPLIEGNVTGAMVNVLSGQGQKPAPRAELDLSPIENSIGELQLHQTELGLRVEQQNNALKRVQDQLEMVREATDRNTLEQQELIEDLRAAGRKLNIVAIALLVLLTVSVALNVVLYLHVTHILP